MQRKWLPENLKANCVLFLDGSVSGTTAYDVSGNGNNGTLVNSPTTQRTQGYKRFVFNGTNTYISVTNSTSLNVWAWDFSVAFTLNLNTLANYDAIINKYRSSPTNKWWTITVWPSVSTAAYIFLYNSGSGWVVWTNSWYLEAGKTHRYIIVRRWWFVDWYKDWVLFQTVTWNTVDTSSTYDLDVWDYWATNSIDGKIINTLVYNKALSATEAYQDYLSFFIP